MERAPVAQPVLPVVGDVEVAVEVDRVDRIGVQVNRAVVDHLVDDVLDVFPVQHPPSGASRGRIGSIACEVGRVNHTVHQSHGVDLVIGRQHVEPRRAADVAGEVVDETHGRVAEFAKEDVHKADGVRHDLTCRVVVQVEGHGRRDGRQRHWHRRGVDRRHHAAARALRVAAISLSIRIAVATRG